jgi:transposase
MNPLEDIASLSREALLAVVAAQQRQIVALTARVEALQADIARLTREAKRQAAPFAKGTRSATPKRPGRKPGTGPFRFRAAPPPEQLFTPPVDVPVVEDICPACGGCLIEESPEEISITELPALPRPQVTRYRVAVCRCTTCGKRVRGQHPDVAPDQYGATAHRLGDRVMAAAHGLHYGLGVPVRKVPAILTALTGVTLTQGAITQDARRRAAGVVGDLYAQLRTAVPEQPVIHTDDTSWRIGGAPAYLMAFETDAATVYQIRTHHRHEEVQELIPATYQGVMVTDRGRSYDAHGLASVKQQKCLAHILRSIREVLAGKKGRARDFGGRLKALLQDALDVWHAWRAGDIATFTARRDDVWDQLTAHLRPRRLTDPDNQRLLNALGRHHDRGNLVRFLADPYVEPTNNRAERALRPAVIARKVSQCSKNALGADTYAAFTSVMRTLAKTCGVPSLVEGLYNLFQSVGMHWVTP